MRMHVLLEVDKDVAPEEQVEVYVQGKKVEKNRLNFYDPEMGKLSPSFLYRKFRVEMLRALGYTVMQISGMSTESKTAVINKFIERDLPERKD